MANDRTYQVLIYGAYGYTGKLVTQLAQQSGLRVLLAGRSEAPLKDLAQQTQLPYLQVSLDDAAALEACLRQCTVVIHCAGPFSRTARQMATACLRAGTHYLDITGELAVFEYLHGLEQAARDSNILLMPGVGFDVVPTDCVANRLKAELPDAHWLELAFVTVGGGISHGTLTSTIERLGTPGAERRNGKLQPVRMGKHGKWINFDEKRRFVISIPWGDLYTAWISTGILNITTYTGASPKLYPWLRFLPLLNPLLRTAWFRGILQKRVDAKVLGPTAEQNAQGYALVYGQARNQAGESRELRLRVNETYRLTAETALLIAQKVLSGHWQPGFHTPAQLYGSGLITEVEGCRWMD
jgi:short subunit dehydrogenase-like uncharacterized protein